MRRRLVAATLAGVLAAVAGCGDDEPSASEQRQEQVSGAAEGAGLPEDVVAFLADAVAGVDGTFRVVYEVADPAGGATQRLTITQAPPDRRIDVDRADGQDTATIGTADGTHECTRPADDQPFTCELVAGTPDEGVFAEDRVEALRTALTDAAASYDFRIEERAVAAVDARCLVAIRRPGVEDPALGAEATLCLSPEGAQLLVDTPSGTLRAIEYATDVPAESFVVPSG